MILIDANALSCDIHEHDYVLKDMFNSTDRGMFTCGIDYAIQIQPNIKFVRCGECRHFDDRHGEVCHNERFGDGWGNYPPPCVDADGGCSYGERRDDE